MEAPTRLPQPGCIKINRAGDARRTEQHARDFGPRPAVGGDAVVRRSVRRHYRDTCGLFTAVPATADALRPSNNDHQPSASRAGARRLAARPPHGTVTGGPAAREDTPVRFGTQVPCDSPAWVATVLSVTSSGVHSGERASAGVWDGDPVGGSWSSSRPRSQRRNRHTFPSQRRAQARREGRA
jgi:hypothetical protein